MFYCFFCYFVLAELNSKDIINFESKVAENKQIVETIIGISISILNEMVGAVNEVTPEEDIDQIYELIADFIQHNKEEPETSLLQNLFKKLEEKIPSYAKLQGRNRIKILANFYKFCSAMKQRYTASVECSKSSILLSVTFSSKEGYDLYKKDLEIGRIGEQILELFFYSPFLENFGLKADDIELSLNGKLLTRHKGKNL